MSFLQHLHGAIALWLLCGLLFAEEAGVPMPFAPGDLVLIAAGLLIATGGLDPWLFIPAAILSCALGALVGYTWSRRLGEPALRSLAERLRATDQLDRVLRRVRGAGPAGIAIARLIPGLRIYTTLAAGAAGVPPSNFLPGMTSATVVWVLGFTALGALAGIQAERILGQLERLAFQGATLLLAGLGTYLVIRTIPRTARGVIAQIPHKVRLLLALVIDSGIVAAIAAGVLSLGRGLIGSADYAWVDIAMVACLVLILYLVIALRRYGGTAGVKLLSRAGRGESPGRASRPPHAPAGDPQASS
jgi:membrane protein DedA with SNARE-associated domain